METSSPSRPITDLPTHLYYQLVYTLTDLLPPPLDDTPAALQARNHAAIAKVAALLPVNANEADLAAHCIAARGQAEEMLRLVRQNAGDIELVMRLNAQYGSTVRTSLAVHGKLMRVQALRQKREAIDGAADEDAWTLHVAERSMVGVVDPAARRQKPAWPGAARIEAARIEAARIEAMRIEAARIEAARVEAMRIEAMGIEAAQVEAAQVEAARVEALTACVDQRTDENVSTDGIESQYTAFETWMSKQPWNREPEGPGETGLRKRVREAMAGSCFAKSRSRAREVPANGREHPESADQDDHINRNPLST